MEDFGIEILPPIWRFEGTDADRRRKAKKKIHDGQQRYFYQLVRSWIGSESEDKLSRKEKKRPSKLKKKLDFENLVLAGGGAKGAAYCGVALELEKYGILKNIKRFAGSSAGAIVAALLAVKCTPNDVKQIMNVNMEDLLRDAPIGHTYINLFSCFGKHPADKFTKFLEEIIEKKTGIPNITFNQVYDICKKELCIMVTNANTMSEEYFHVKTTPNMPICKAVRMSVAFPVEFKPVSCEIDGEESLYIDGGLVCNYPINSFDGWFLSMDNVENKKIHSQMKEIYDENPLAVAKINWKTLGCVVFSEKEFHAFRFDIDRTRKEKVNLPDTKLARKWKKKQQEAIHKFSLYKKIKEAETNILAYVEDKGIANFLCEDVEDILDKKKADAAMLFGEHLEATTIFQAIIKEDPQKTTKQELENYINETSSSLITRYVIARHKRKRICRFDGFLRTIITGLNTEVIKVFFKKRDVQRTVGINTWYIETEDFALEESDKQFLIEQGQRSTKQFLDDFVSKNKIQLEELELPDTSIHDIGEQISAIIERHESQKNVIFRSLLRSLFMIGCDMLWKYVFNNSNRFHWHFSIEN